MSEKLIPVPPHHICCLYMEGAKTLPGGCRPIRESDELRIENARLRRVEDAARACFEDDDGSGRIVFVGMMESKEDTTTRRIDILRAALEVKP